MRRLTIILDRAHGSNVAGKGSPDGRHKEWIWSKKQLNAIADHLESIGFRVISIVPEDTEPGLLERVRRMNRIMGPAIVFSLHNNAAGMGDVWKEAHGYSVWTTRGRTKSDQCATILFNKLRSAFPKIAYRKDESDGDPDFESNFSVLTSKHPSILLEWMFQDNEADLAIIENELICVSLRTIICDSLIEIEKYLCAGIM